MKDTRTPRDAGISVVPKSDSGAPSDLDHPSFTNLLLALAPFLGHAIRADEDSLAAARKTMAIHLAPVARAIVIAVPDIDIDAILAAPDTAMKRGSKRAKRVFSRLRCNVDDPLALFQASLIWFVHDLFPMIPGEIMSTWERSVAEVKQHLDENADFRAMDRLVGDALASDHESAQRAFDEVEFSRIDINVIRAYSVLREVEGTSGEKRARRVMEAARMISESIYRPYVACVYKLAGATKGRQYADADNYGSALNNLITAGFTTTYPELLELNAVFVRNAQAHDSWKYHYDSDSIELWDKNKPAATRPVDDLLKKSALMLRGAGVVFPKVVRAAKGAPAAKWFQGVESVWVELLSKDSATRRAAFQLLLEQVHHQTPSAKATTKLGRLRRTVSK